MDSSRRILEASRCLFSGSHNEFPKFNGTMVALEEERARFSLAGVKRTTGDARYLLLGNDGYAIELHRLKWTTFS